METFKEEQRVMYQYISYCENGVTVLAKSNKEICCVKIIYNFKAYLSIYHLNFAFR